MQKFYTLFVALIITGCLMAQTPQGFKYQAVARDASGDVVADQAVGMKISILQSSTSGTAVYVETFTPTTNEFGLMNLNIGAGTVVSGDLTTIDWSADTYFIKIEMDMTGGTTYVEYGTSQLLSVPYALHAKTAETFTGTITETDPLFTVWDKTTGISITESQISDLNHFTNTDETDQIFTASVANNINASDTTRWGSTASEVDPLFTAWDKTTGISITESQINDLDHFTTSDETDPVFGAHAANGISSTNITNWTTAYGWGNHASAGYLTSFTELDPVFVAHAASGVTSTLIGNWNSAYGWGDHLGLYRPIGYVPAWSEITSKPTTISGYGITDAFSGSYTDLTNKPTTIAGYGITDAFDGTWNNLTGKPTFATVATSGDYDDLSNKLSEGTGISISGLNVISSTITGLPDQSTHNENFLTTNGANASWVSIDNSTVGLGNVENTALSSWAGTTNITALGTITSGTWQGDVIALTRGGTGASSLIGARNNLDLGTTDDVTFNSITASNGLLVNDGTITIKPAGTTGSNGQFLQTDGSGIVSWANDNVDDADANASNEIQTLSINTNQLTISGPGGNSVTFTDWDTDATNDVTLTSPATGDMLYYNGGNWTAVPKGTDDQVLTLDGSPTWKDASGGSGSFYLGQDTLGGIVYYIYIGSDGLQHGLIVAKTESTAQWQNTGTTTNATRSWDGVYNMNLMSDSPARTYVEGLGAGWYLPSIDELSILWHNRFHVNKAMNDGSFTFLSLGAYWSSTESSATDAWHFNFDSGDASYHGKTGTYSVRAVSAF